MQATKRLTGWVDERLISRLQELQRRLPHAPTLTMVAAAVLAHGLDVLAGRDIADQLRVYPESPGSKRALTLRLPLALHVAVKMYEDGAPGVGTMVPTVNLQESPDEWILCDRNGRA